MIKPSQDYRSPFGIMNLGIIPCCINPANIYLFKVNNRNTRKRCKKCSKLTIKTPDDILTFISPEILL